MLQDDEKCIKKLPLLRCSDITKGKVSVWFCFSDNFPTFLFNILHTGAFLVIIWGKISSIKKSHGVQSKGLMCDLVKPFIHTLFIILWPPGC